MTQGQALSLRRQVSLVRSVAQAQVPSLSSLVRLTRALGQSQAAVLVRLARLVRLVAAPQAVSLTVQPQVRTYLLTVSTQVHTQATLSAQLPTTVVVWDVASQCFRQVSGYPAVYWNGSYFRFEPNFAVSWIAPEFEYADAE